ncbi:GNAT family N-acetyltransferase [Streptomyces sp. NPDC127068]|uniref:GNAT family N-acetyltransferase n=1 Tax=Streptomyces sp. NPDC127068 TaxID=3347127 RepID=UPI003650BA36
MSTPSLSLSALPIRRLTRRDTTLCADLSHDRGWPREEHKWGLLLAAGTAYGMDAPDGNGLLSTCVVTSYGPPGNPDLQAIGMVLVAARYARRGVGRHLIRHVLTEAGSTPLTLHATANGRPLYEELGFKTVGGVESLQGTFTPEGQEPRIATRPATAEDLPTILHLDGAVFGSDRTHMITRLPAFADRLRVAEERGRIIGYGGIWPNTGAEVVGPLIARDTETAVALIASLAAGATRPVRVDVDARHEDVLSWLRERGLTPSFHNDVMTYGTTELPGDWTRRFAPLTVAAG